MAKQISQIDVDPIDESTPQEGKGTPLTYSKMVNLSGNPARLAELFAKYFEVYPSYFVSCLVAGCASLPREMLVDLLAAGESQAGKFGGLQYTNPDYIPQALIDEVDHARKSTSNES